MLLRKIAPDLTVSSRVRVSFIVGLLFLNLSTEIVAQASVPTPATLPSITPYGLVHYRLRGNLNSQKDTAGNTLSQNIYSHRVAYYLGVKAQVSDQLSVQVQIGNDWVMTDVVNYKLNNNWNYSKGIAPYFNLAFATWNPGPFNFSIGKLPVVSYGPLDLLERSIATNTYGSGGPGLGASFLGWISGTSNALIGLKAGIPVLKSETKLAATLTYAIIDGDGALNTIRGQILSNDPKRNPSAQLLILDLPFANGALSLTPQFFTVLNRNFNKNTEKSDVEFGAGIDAGIKAGKISFRAKGGYATYSNKNTRTDFPVNDTTISTLPKLKQVGAIGSVGTSIPAGPGIALLDIAISSDENSVVQGSRIIYPYIDAKYNWSPTKNFDIIPRVRFFITQYGNSYALDSRTWIWPELIFQAKF
mgnify:FL=1